MNLINVFIPAAGLGERLRPITDLIPKPLIPVLGKPILQIILEKMTTLPVRKIAINLHYKREKLKQWLIHSNFNTMIEIFPEEPILGTGGAFKNAETLLKDSMFLVHNSDIVSDIDLKTLLDKHLSSQNLVTLAVHDYPKFNKLEIDENGFLIRFFSRPHPTPPPSRGLRILAFTGIAVYSPEFLRFLPLGISSVVDAWTKAIGEGYKIGTLDVTGCYWSDIGTPNSYAKAVINELRKNGETVYIHPSVDWCKDIEMDGYVVIENISNPPSPPFNKGGDDSIPGEHAKFTDKDDLDRKILFRNCILLTQNIIKKEASHNTIPPFLKGDKGGLLIENCILGSGFKIELDESEIFNLFRGNDLVQIGTGGSDRKYFRVKTNGQTVILMECNDEDQDFSRHVEYTRFFRRYSIPVPELIEADQQNMSAIFEDLGDLSLYNWLKCQREKEQIEKVYKEVIDILILIHTVATEHIDECPLLQKRIFDYEHLRWETSYFLERFVIGIMNITLKNLPALNDEFHRLAVSVNSFPKTIVHRDFQSQNLMITKGGPPRLLDYQGARIGPPAYDLVSILWDPYYRLEDDLRERLLNYYIDKVIPLIPPLQKGGITNHHNNRNSNLKNFSPFTKGGLRGITDTDFRETILPCRLQRHMQALGAYSFLSKIKGKKFFLKHVPEGLRLLKEDVSLSKDKYPELYNLVMFL
ncbi:MAG: sugar phosphate nucleotidyltransferase [Nitrospirota bacterium]